MVSVIINGMCLRHLSNTDPEPVNIDGMEFRERLESGQPFPYPVQASFNKYAGVAYVTRGHDGNLYAECHVNPDMIPKAHTHLAVGISFVKATRSQERIHRSKLLAIGTTDNNVDPSIPPFTTTP